MPTNRSLSVYVFLFFQGTRLLENAKLCVYVMSDSVNSTSTSCSFYYIRVHFQLPIIYIYINYEKYNKERK